MKRLRELLVVASLLLVLGACSSEKDGEAYAQAEANNQLQIGCTVPLTARIDLIFPGAGHNHQFAGTTQGLTQETTASQLLTRTTSCGFSAHKSLYWIPQTFEQGRLIKPSKLTSYTQNFGPGTMTRPPDGLGLLASRATGQGKVQFRCGPGDVRESIPYGCNADNWRVQYLFPNCWDGEGLTPDDTYYTGHQGCRDGHKRLPNFRVTYHMPNTDRNLQAPVTVSIGTDQTGEMEGFGHADLFIAMTNADWSRMQAYNAGNFSQPCKFNPNGPA